MQKFEICIVDVGLDRSTERRLVIIHGGRTSCNCFDTMVSTDIITNKFEIVYLFAIRDRSGLGTRVVFHLSQLFYGFSPYWIEHDLLPQQARMRLVHRKTQHNEVAILSENAMRCIGVVAGLVLLVTDEFHDLVLSLPRHVVTTKDYGKVTPSWICLKFVTDER